MGRINRRSLLFDGCYAHVFSRATEKKYIFEGEEDFGKFKEILQESKRKYSYRIHHYCLMHTHFHLVVSVGSVEEFSRGLKWVKWNYARYFNVRRKRFLIKGSKGQSQRGQVFNCKLRAFSNSQT